MGEIEQVKWKMLVDEGPEGIRPGITAVEMSGVGLSVKDYVPGLWLTAVIV